LSRSSLTGVIESLIGFVISTGMVPVIKGLTVWSYYAVTLSALSTQHSWNAQWQEHVEAPTLQQRSKRNLLSHDVMHYTYNNCI